MTKAQAKKVTENITIKLCRYFSKTTGYCGNPQRLLNDLRHTFQNYNGQIICDYRENTNVMEVCPFNTKKK